MDDAGAPRDQAQGEANRDERLGLALAEQMRQQYLALSLEQRELCLSVEGLIAVTCLEVEESRHMYQGDKSVWARYHSRVIANATAANVEDKPP